MKEFIEKIRIPDEKKILNNLEEVLNFSMISDLLSFHVSQKKEQTLSKKMQFYLPLSPQVVGKLYSLTQEIIHQFNYTDRQVIFYISNDSDFNLNEDEPHYIVFNSGIVEKHTEDEMRFIIGHELGHLIYKHHIIGHVLDHIYPSRLPDFLKVIHQLWSNISEMSADRLGLLAVEDFETAVSVMFRLCSGLDMERLNVTAMNFMAVNDNLVSDMTTSRQNYLTETHPANSIRMKALDIFYHSRMYKTFLKNGKFVQDNKIRQQTDELIALLHEQPDDDIDRAVLDFLTAAGYYLINNDREITIEKYEELMNMLSSFHSWPPDYVNQLLQKKKLMSIINKSASIIIEKCPAIAPGLFAKLVHLIAKDQRIKKDEFDILLLIAEKLKLPKRDTVEMILQEIKDK